MKKVFISLLILVIFFMSLGLVVFVGTNYFQSITISNHATVNNGIAPVLSACGTSPTIVTGATDHAGKFTIGATGTGCVITFSTAYTNAPACVVTGAAAVTDTTTASALTVTATAGGYSYICYGVGE